MRMSVKDFLVNCSDWSGPREVAERICGPDYTPDELRKVINGLKAMRGLRMAEYHKGNNTYRCYPPELIAIPSPTRETE